MDDQPNHTPAAPSLRSFLAEQDAPCPSCGYNLRGLTGGFCPECHEALELRVGLVHRKLGAFVTALVGLAAGAGFGGMLLVYFLFVLATRASGSRGLRSFAFITGGGLLVEGMLLVLLVRRRAWFVQRGPWARRGMAAGAWALTLAVLILFMAFVR